MKPQFDFTKNTRPRAQHCELVPFNWAKYKAALFLVVFCFLFSNKKGGRKRLKMELSCAHRTTLPP